MANNQSIQFLRGTSAQKKAAGTSTILLAGQPFYETDTYRLYIGDGSTTLDTLKHVDGSVYDTVISNQEEFEAWYAELDAETYKGRSVLILSGAYTRSDGKGLHLPATLKQLHGLGTVTINITNFLYSNTNRGGIWYTKIPTAKEYSIENIALNCIGTDSSYGFYACTNLTNCTGFSSGNGSGDCYGFYSCTNLTNCKGIGIDRGFYACTNLTNCTGFSSGNGYGSGFYSCTNLTNCISSSDGSYYGFYSCTNLTNCTGIGILSGFYECTYLTNCTGNGSSYGFYSCTNLTNCKGIGGTSSGNGINSGFFSCTNLTNCTGYGISSRDGYGYGFYSCEICSNCRQNPTDNSTTSTWGGTNKNISKDTCPEYPG